jgi:hypothetical protein
MKPLNVELMSDHSTGISDNYWRPTEKEVLEDYLKAVDALTINSDKVTLQRQVTKLTETAVTEAETMKKRVDEMQARQTAFELVLKKIIADEQDWDPRNPKEKKRIEETFQRIMNPNSNFFDG